MSTCLIVPRARDGQEPLSLDLTEIRQAERRLGEVAMTNAVRAPELLALYNGAYLMVRRYINLLEYEENVAERRLEEVRAIFIVDKLPELLAAKGLATSRSPLGSEDIRTAFLALDPEYKRMQEMLSTIKAYSALLKTMETGFENAYNSVKKLLGVGTDPTTRANPNLVQPLYENSVTSGMSTHAQSRSTATESIEDFFGKD